MLFNNVQRLLSAFLCFLHLDEILFDQALPPFRISLSIFFYIAARKKYNLIQNYVLRLLSL